MDAHAALLRAEDHLEPAAKVPRTGDVGTNDAILIALLSIAISLRQCVQILGEIADGLGPEARVGRIADALAEARRALGGSR